MALRKGISLLICFLAIFCCSGTVFSSDAPLANPTHSSTETKPGLPSDQKILEVHQNQVTGLFTIRANQIPRQDILQKIADLTQLRVRSLDEELLQDPFNVDVQDIPANQIVNQLLEDLNTVFVYAPAGDTTYDSEPRLAKVLIMSRKQGMPTGLKAIQTLDESTGEQEEGRQIVMQSKLGQSIVGNNHFATRRLLRELLATGTKYEKQKAAEDAANIILDPSLYDSADTGHLFFEALKALKELNPANAEAFLSDLIENGNEAWVQSQAAINLGEFGGNNSIAPLLTALANDNYLVQNAAVQSLAKIGDPQGLNQLLNLMGQGDPDLQQQIVNALANSNSNNSQLALNQALSNQPVSGGVAPLDPKINTQQNQSANGSE